MPPSTAGSAARWLQNTRKAKHDSGQSACGHWEKNGLKARETPRGWRRERKEAFCIGILGSERIRICWKAVERQASRGPRDSGHLWSHPACWLRWPRRSLSTQEVWFPRCPAVLLPASPCWGLRVRSKHSGSPLIGAPSVHPTPWPVSQEGSAHSQLAGLGRPFPPGEGAHGDRRSVAVVGTWRVLSANVGCFGSL